MVIDASNKQKKIIEEDMWKENKEQQNFNDAKKIYFQAKAQMANLIGKF